MKPVIALLLLASTTPALAQSPSPAQAASEDRVALDILRTCARLADPMARVACYDRNIGVDIARAEPARPAATPPAAAPMPAPAAAPAPAVFGANQLPAPGRPAAPPQEALTARITAATERTPGIWLVTLADGAQWQFVDAVPPSFDPPRAGASVTIIAASLGSYIMRYREQRGIRIRRVR